VTITLITKEQAKFAIQQVGNTRWAFEDWLDSATSILDEQTTKLPVERFPRWNGENWQYSATSILDEQTAKLPVERFPQWNGEDWLNSATSILDEQTAEDDVAA